MQIKLIFVPLCALLALAVFTLPAQSDGHLESERIEAAARDYVLGFYRGDTERLERSLSPEMKKLGYGRRAAEGPYQGPFYMTKESAKEFAPGYAAEAQFAEDTFYRIEILDQLDQIATVKLEAVWGIDYMQLAKTDGKWLIYNVIWQSWPDGQERR